MQPNNTKYDVVISFSEEQKDIAVGICLALENIGISTYYYPYKGEENLGKNLESNLDKIYSNSAIIAIAILSKKYFSSVFTKVELKAILKRLKVDSDYFIPIRYGNTQLPRHLALLTYIQWQSDIKDLVSVVKKRLEEKVNLYLEYNPQKIGKLSKATLLNAINRFSKFKHLGNSDFHFRLALYYYYLNQSNNDLKLAIHYLEKVSINSPSSHAAFYWLSRITIEEKGINKIKYKDIKKPVDWLNKALQLAPNTYSYKEFSHYLNEKFFKKYGLKKPFNN